MSPYVFKRSARSPRAVGFVVLWWAVLGLLYLSLDAAPWIILILACASLPALFEIGQGATSELRISQTDIQWHSGRRKADLARNQLKSVRLDTRLDLSLRMTLMTHHGQKLRLPYECVPTATDIEAALTRFDIPFERHHFALMS